MLDAIYIYVLPYATSIDKIKYQIVKLLHTTAHIDIDLFL